MDSKSIFLSKRFWGAVLAILGHFGFFTWLAAHAGVPVPTDMNATANMIVGGIGDVIAAYGAFTATQPLHVLVPSSSSAQGGFASIPMLLSILCMMMIGLGLLAACTTTPKTPEQALYVAKSDYLAALDLAVIYKRLPPCGSVGAGAVCASAAIVVKLQAVDDCAYSLLTVATNKAQGIAAPVPVRCSDTDLAASATAISSLDISGLVSLAQRAIGSFTKMTGALGVK